MRKKINLLIGTVLILACHSISSAQMTECLEYNEFNFEEYVRPEDAASAAFRASCYYADRFLSGGFEENGLTREDIEAYTLNMLNGQFSTNEYDSSLDPEELKYIAGTEFHSGELVNTMEFTLIGSSQECSDYYGIYVDFDEAFRTAVPSASTPFTMPIEGLHSKKLYLVKSVCGITQAGLFIIIIDQDIILGTEFTIPVQEAAPPETTARSQFGSSTRDVSDFSLFPNPVNEDFATLKFNLEQKQNVAISIIEGSTGKNIQSNEQFLDKGNHSNQIDLQRFPAGVYFVVLQTEEGRKVEKLLKMK